MTVSRVKQDRDAITCRSFTARGSWPFESDRCLRPRWAGIATDSMERNVPVKKTTDMSQPSTDLVGDEPAGLAAANRAVDLAGRVLLLEKGSEVGGSAALSAGILWTAPDVEVGRRIQPDGDPLLTRLVIEGYEQAVADVRAAGVTVSPEWRDHLEWGRACKIDLADLFARWSAKVKSSG